MNLWRLIISMKQEYIEVREIWQSFNTKRLLVIKEDLNNMFKYFMEINNFDNAIEVNDKLEKVNKELQRRNYKELLDVSLTTTSIF
jgi:hypothetical protein